MTARDSRQLALQILNELEKRQVSLDQLIGQRFEQTAPEIDRRDKALCFAIIYGVLRWRAKIDWHIGRMASRPVAKIRPDILNILRMGLFQILFLSRIPDSAAVNTSVEIAKTKASAKTAGFVNAVLRNAVRQKNSLANPAVLKDQLQEIAIAQSCPLWLVRRWHKRFGAEETKLLCNYINQIPPLTLRTNTMKTERDCLIEKFKNAGAAEKIIPTRYSSAGLSLYNPRMQVSELPGYKEGLFQVQDEAAQLAAFILDCRKGENVLDACAGLGGKTGHMAQLMTNHGKISAMDHDPEKLKSLCIEMKRIGADIVERCCHDLNKAPDHLKSKHFDRILLDAPCSGLGVIRRNPDMKWAAKEKNLVRQSRRQAIFLGNSAGLLDQPGGVLVYAVCSTEPEETRDVVSAFLKTNPGFEIEPVNDLFPGLSALTDDMGCLCSIPHRHDMDGFFIARLKKN